MSQFAEDRHDDRRSCGFYGCTTVAMIVLAIAGWIASGFIVWKECRIPLPSGYGAVVYMARLHKIPSAEWERKVRILTKRMCGDTKWIPGDPSGAYPVNVYWYPAVANIGPHLRFRDPVWEYLVDLRHGTVLLVQRHDDGSASVGEISSAWPHTGWVEDSATGQILNTVDGHRVRKLESRIARKRGVYLGRIEYPFNRFVSRKEAPEEALPQH